MNVTVGLVVIVQTLGVVDLNCTAKLELAVACSVTERAEKSVAGGGVKVVIVCAIRRFSDCVTLGAVPCIAVSVQVPELRIVTVPFASIVHTGVVVLVKATVPTPPPAETENVPFRT